MFKKVLLPLSLLWDFVYRLRRFLYQYRVFKKNYFKVPIFSVGNLTFGGTGKTPMIIWLVELIESLHKTPLVLTRGYKGDLEKGNGVIGPENIHEFKPEAVGDEPYLIASKMETGAVVVGRERSKNLHQYFNLVSPDIVLLDDGFQHLQLHRSFNLVLFDAILSLESYKTAPLGYLREGLTALKDADAIAISRSDQVSSEKLNELINLLSKYKREEVPIAKFRYEAQGLFSISNHLSFNTNDLEGKNFIAVTGLASPQSFYHSLESLGAKLVLKKAFSDHHAFSQEDIDSLIELSKEHNAPIVVSEKDIVKIKQITQETCFLYLRISVDFMSGESFLVERVKNFLSLDSH